MNVMISIIVPAFNAEKYIEDCLQSIVEQTCVDWECLVIEDGTHDSTESIVAGFACKFTDKFKYHRLSENRGPAAVRNYGIRESHGDFVAFIDSDDIWD